MTQLNLSGRQSSDTKRNSATEATEAKDESIKNQTVGALGALAMFAAVIVIGSCSRSSKPVAVQQTHSTHGAGVGARHGSSARRPLRRRSR